MKKLLQPKVLGALGVLIIVGVLVSTVQVGAQVVSIDANLSISPNIISFETVFPGEVHYKPLVVNLSDSFLGEDILDDVEYRIVQKPKPRIDSPEEREYCSHFPNDLTRCYPSLCPYLSKTADNTPANDTSIPAYHDPDAPSSIAYGRLAKSDNDIEDNWVIDLHTPCFRGQCDQTNSVPEHYQLDPSMNGQVFGCDLVVEVLSISYNKKCPTCELGPDGQPIVIEVANDISIDFNQNPPAYIGDPALQPYFMYSKASSTPSGWNAIFDTGGKSIHFGSGVTLTTVPVGTGNSKYAPGIMIKTKCDLVADASSEIIVHSTNQDAGDIVINTGHNAKINGLIRNQQGASLRRPGNITVAAWCGDITQGKDGWVDDWGRHAGARTINLLACDVGNIEINGLVLGRASINSPNPKSQPKINVASFAGSVAVNANTTQPLYPHFSYSGSTKSMWGGLISWISGHYKPGAVRVQAEKDITVRGHGKGTYDSFGAISAKAFSSGSNGGLVDVRSLSGNISGSDRAFDVEARNANDTIPYGAINLASGKNIFLSRLGLNADFGPTLDARSSGGGSHGGSNFIRAYQGAVTNGTNSVISADATGTNSTDGTNNLTSCTGVTNTGTIFPADANGVDNIGACADAEPQPMWQSCADFGLNP
ncbi:MAG: hypothetical protein AAB417_02465 [Patescibacteria group bacterium]